MSPLGSSIPFIFTVHDLIHVRAVRGVRAIYFESVLRPLCKKAYKIVTVSDFSREEICEWANLPPDRVVRIYNAASSRFTPEGPGFSPGYPYLLYVGVRSAHKNLPRMVEAFAKSGLATQCKLLFSGEPDADLQAAACALHIGDSIKFAGMIPDALLPSYYRGALALLLVSTYEGFGLPAVEAMACGIPVLCSNTSSLPEVAGDAALFVNPLDVEEMAHGMNKIGSDAALRQACRDKGLSRRSVFSWDRSAERLSRVLMEACAAGSTSRSQL